MAEIEKLADGTYVTRPTYSNPNTRRIVEVVDNKVVSINGNTEHVFTVYHFFQVNIIIEEKE